MSSTTNPARDFIDYHLKQENKVKELEAKNLELNVTIKTSGEELSRARKENIALKTDIRAIRAEKDKSDAQIEELKGKITLLRGQITEMALNEVDDSELRLWKNKFEEQEIELEKFRDVIRRVNGLHSNSDSMTKNFHPDAIRGILDMRVNPLDGVQEFKTAFTNRRRSKWLTIDNFMDSNDDTYTALERFLCKKMNIDLYNPDLDSSSSPTPTNPDVRESPPPLPTHEEMEFEKGNSDTISEDNCVNDAVQFKTPPRQVIDTNPRRVLHPLAPVPKRMRLLPEGGLPALNGNPIALAATAAVNSAAAMPQTPPRGATPLA